MSEPLYAKFRHEGDVLTNVPRDAPYKRHAEALLKEYRQAHPETAEKQLVTLCVHVDRQGQDVSPAWRRERSAHDYRVAREQGYECLGTLLVSHDDACARRLRGREGQAALTVPCRCVHPEVHLIVDDGHATILCSHVPDETHACYDGATRLEAHEHQARR